MSCTVVNSQASLGTQLPALPATLPSNQSQWQSFVTALQQWGAILKQEQNAPNVLPTMFQTFATASAALPLASLTAVSCTPTIDNTQQYYGNASLKVVPASAGATLAFTGFPIAMESASKWFCAFQIYAPSGLVGSLTVATSGGTILTETFTVPALAGWQQVWGIFDFSADSTPTSTWEFTFTNVETVWFDGMQMSVLGDNIINLPAFSSSQMVAGGPLAFITNLDGIPDGSTYAKTLSANVIAGVSYNYKGAWSSGAAYVTGDEVLSGAAYYIAVANSTNQVPPNATYWQLVGPTSVDGVPDGSTYARTKGSHVVNGVAYNYKGAYSGATAYVQGDEVLQAGNYYVATANTTGNAPPNASFWQLVGPGTLDNVSNGSTYSKVLAAFVNQGVAYNFQGTYAGGTTYPIGAEVDYLGNYYLATAITTGNLPTNPSFWQILGPDTLDNLGDGTGRFAVNNGAGLKGVNSVDGGNLALINFASGHTGKNVDNVADGATYGRFLNTGMTGNIANTAGLVPNAVTIPAAIESTATVGAVMYINIPSSAIPPGQSTVGVLITGSQVNGSAGGSFDLTILPGIVSMTTSSSTTYSYQYYLPTYNAFGQITGYTGPFTKSVTYSGVPFAKQGNVQSVTYNGADAPMMTVATVQQLTAGMYTLACYDFNGTNGWASWSKYQSMSATVCMR